MNITDIDISTSHVIVAIVAAGLAFLAAAWCYERDGKNYRAIIANLSSALLEKTYDWLDVREDLAHMTADRDSWREEAFSFSAALQRHIEAKGQGEAALWVAENLSEPSFSEHLATLFDQELMQGNND